MFQIGDMSDQGHKKVCPLCQDDTDDDTPRQGVDPCKTEGCPNTALTNWGGYCYECGLENGQG